VPLPRFRWWVDYVSRGLPRSTSRYSLRPLCRLLPSIRACAVPAMAPSAVLPPAASITSLSTGTFQLADVRGRAERPDDGGDKPGLRALLHWEKPSDSRWAMSLLPFDQRQLCLPVLQQLEAAARPPPPARGGGAGPLRRRRVLQHKISLAQHWARDWRALALTQVHHVRGQSCTAADDGQRSSRGLIGKVTHRRHS